MIPDVIISTDIIRIEITVGIMVIIKVRTEVIIQATVIITVITRGITDMAVIIRPVNQISLKRSRKARCLRCAH